MVSGPVLFKIKGPSWIFILVGVNKPKQKTEIVDEIGQMLVPGALNDTKKIRKAGESSPRDLAIGHGFEARSLGNNRNKLDFHTCWD